MIRRSLICSCSTLRPLSLILSNSNQHASLRSLQLVPDYNVLDAGKPLLSSYRRLLRWECAAVRRSNAPLKTRNFCGKPINSNRKNATLFAICFAHCSFKPKSRSRRFIFKVWMPVAHFIKARNDRIFFRKLHNEMGVEWKGGGRRRRLRKLIGSSLAAGLTVSLARWIKVTW